MSGTRPPMDAWGLTGEAVPLAGGAQQAVFRVGGWVLKTTRRAAEQIAWAERLKDCARAAGFAVPACCVTEAGAVLVAGWTCEEYIAGRGATGAEAAQCTRQVRRMHARSAAMGQRPGFCAARDLMRGMSGGDADFAVMPAGIVAAGRDAFRALEGMECVGIHGDLHRGNMIVTDDGRMALIDWEEARVDAAVFDLAAVDPWMAVAPDVRAALTAWEVAVCWRAEPDRAWDLARGMGWL